MIVIDPDCLVCAMCGQLIGRGPYSLTASNAVVHRECAEHSCGACEGRGGFAASGETCEECLGTGSVPANETQDS